MASKRPSAAETRRKALEEARAEVRADILLDGLPNYEATLDRVSKSLDKMIEATR